MEIFLVGGAVRDELLGLPVQDRDHVVVGATPQQLLALGFLPVGKDFPVFLHPGTHEEYALARTERKTGPGYHGFAVHSAPNVTLGEDLARRDLTINAMAKRAPDLGVGGVRPHASGDLAALIDPYGGRADLQARVLRHVTDAFREDPVRILRTARFAARFTDFHVAPETAQLMAEMVQAGEADALVAERVWQELSRGLMEAQPSRMWQVLAACGATARLLPESAQGLPQTTLDALDAAALLGAPLAARYALLCADLAPGGAQALGQRFRVPTECKDMAALLIRERAALAQLARRLAGHLAVESGAAKAAASIECATELASLLERTDAFRRPERLALLLQTAGVGAPLREAAQLALQAANAVDVEQVAKNARTAWMLAKAADATYAANVGEAIKAGVAQARWAAVCTALGTQTSVA